MKDIYSLTTEEKRNNLNLETRALLSVIDMINNEKNDYFNYEMDSMSEDDFLIKEYELIKEAKEKLIKIF